MDFSLILATIGRVREVETFLESLERQTCRSFELVIVDQNPDDRLALLVSRYRKRFIIRHLQSEPGLSRARNVGLGHLSGNVVAFPDDDCWYPQTLLEQVRDLLESGPQLEGVAGRCLTAAGTTRGRWATRAAFLRKYNIFGRCISFAMFLRRSLVEKIGPFDESLGLGSGSRWQGAEDYDYLLRAALSDSAVYYDPQVVVYHPELTSAFDETDRRKRYGNALGFGRFLKKHHYPLAFVAYYSTRYLGDAALSFGRGNIAKARYRWATLIGTFEGWLAPAAVPAASFGENGNRTT
jgi:glycosyltransferase involved in cell wall biosynthesis